MAGEVFLEFLTQLSIKSYFSADENKNWQSKGSLCKSAKSTSQKTLSYQSETNCVVVVVPKSRMVRKQSSNGEIHFIIPELDETMENEEDYDDYQIRIIMKKEASKPLLLLRTE